MAEGQTSSFEERRRPLTLLPPALKKAWLPDPGAKAPAGPAGTAGQQREEGRLANATTTGPQSGGSNSPDEPGSARSSQPWTDPLVREPAPQEPNQRSVFPVSARCSEASAAAVGEGVCSPLSAQRGKTRRGLVRRINVNTIKPRCRRGRAQNGRTGGKRSVF